VLKTGKVEDAIFYAMMPAGRAGKKPAEMYKEYKANADTRSFESSYSNIERLKRRLDSSPQEDVHFVRIESHGLDGLTQFAAALFELHGPGNAEFPAKEEYAIMVMKGLPVGKKTEWYVEDVKYPYEPSTYVHQAKKADDGHGHSH